MSTTLRAAYIFNDIMVVLDKSTVRNSKDGEFREITLALTLGEIQELHEEAQFMADEDECDE